MFRGLATSGLPLSLPQGPPPIAAPPPSPPALRLPCLFLSVCSASWQHCKVAKLSKWPQLSHVAASQAAARGMWQVASAVCAALEGEANQTCHK